MKFFISNFTIGVNINAFGREILLFGCHPTFQLGCRAFCIFHIVRAIHQFVLFCAFYIFGSVHTSAEFARAKDIRGYLTLGKIQLPIMAMKKILDGASVCISSCAGH